MLESTGTVTCTAPGAETQGPGRDRKIAAHLRQLQALGLSVTIEEAA